MHGVQTVGYGVGIFDTSLLLRASTIKSLVLLGISILYQPSFVSMLRCKLLLPP